MSERNSFAYHKSLFRGYGVGYIADVYINKGIVLYDVYFCDGTNLQLPKSEMVILPFAPIEIPEDSDND